MSIETRLQALENIILNSKQGNLVPTATDIQNIDVLYFYNSITLRTESITKAKLLEGAIGLWKYIENSFVEKGAGKVSENVLESTDVVYFKKITNGSDPLTLLGMTYDALEVGGLDKQLRTSYTQTQAIDI